MKAGDWIVRMDQPYTATVRTLLAIQRYKPEDPAPYDDTGWTLDELRHVETRRHRRLRVLGRPMTMLAADARSRAPWRERDRCSWSRTWATGVRRSPLESRGWSSVSVADSEFDAGGLQYPPAPSS